MRVIKTESIKMQWGTFTLPILVGTPISAEGVLSDDENAIGIIVRQVNVIPPVDRCAVMNGGIVDIAELDYDISNEAMGAIPGVLFYQSDMRPYQQDLDIITQAQEAVEAANMAVETAGAAVESAEAAKDAAQQAAEAAETYSGSAQLIDHSDSDATYVAKFVITSDGYPGIEVSETE